MYLCLFEDDQVAHLQPLVYTRAAYDLRLGIRTLAETAHEAFGKPSLLLHARPLVASVTAQEYDALVNRIPDGLDVLFVNGRFVAADTPVLERLKQAARPGEPGRVFVQDDVVVAAWVPEASSRLVQDGAVTRATFEGLPEEHVEGAPLISRLWHLLDALHPALLRDFAVRTKGYNIYERPGADIREGALLAGGEHIYVGPGATIRPGAVLNAEDGPVYVDRDALVMEHAVVRGPAYIGPRAQVKVGGHVEGSAVGPWSKVDGEVLESIFHSLSNKVHEGHLGNAYIGQWCNLGAGTNNSNLKNDYGTVSVYDPASGEYESTERQFVGLFMGDHSKCSIGTMFNTGTVVGVFCNLFGTGFHDRYVPSFSWGSPGEYVEYRLDKALRVAEAVMARRDTPLTDADHEMLAAVFEMTRAERAVAS